MNSRLKNSYRQLEQAGLDALIVSVPANISYLVGFRSRDAYLIVSKKGNIYLTDSRYTEEVRPLLKDNAVLKKINGSLFKLIADSCIELGHKRIGFEERNLPFAEYQKIKQGLDRKCRLIGTHSLIEELRQTKEPEEISKIKKAIEINAAALKFCQSILAPGKREIEVVGELESFIRHQGAFIPSFDIIVAGGPNSAYPHHISSERKLQKNEPVMVDLGIDYQEYKSDLTRVYFFSKIEGLHRKIFDIVRKAQAKAIEKIRPEAVVKEVDRAARQYIAQFGFGEFFGHSLGHGIGLEVHEDPRLSAKRDDVLKPGMIFTVEPAIYLPGKFGIRIEDMVLVTKKGCEVLSGAIH